ncbi:hypothetical protein CEE37_14000 [candidate division LCP-89 bacterium B3_LCP]|uniref:Sulfatase N-terminal domain-containing protein n=1 Tax=candidate division LCP-89 bacterium B3_LCP TaxID=2012998 RepID=A0A532URQ4_UNCL8|nr:MAG: hypothetical protein CEE37_14000 [candidate division LCP-89 bacterium B3_LCP]
MKNHIKASIVLWTIAAFILTEIAINASRLYISPLNFWKLLLGTAIFYNVFGLILAVISRIIESLIYRSNTEKAERFHPWVFGAVHGGTVVFLSLFYWLNKTMQPEIWSLSFEGIAANLAVAVSGLIAGAAVVTILANLSGKFWKVTLVLFLVAFAIINHGMHFKVKAFQNKEVIGKDAERLDTGLKVLLIGTDGATWDVLDSLITAGATPNFARLVNDGFSDRFRTIMPTSSPIIWTSVATGKKAHKHGVSNVVFTVIPGMSNSIVHFSNFLSAKTISQLLMDWGIFYSVPVSSSIRQSKALWNINTDYGLTTDVVAWWGTWPPDSIKGNIVSDLASSYKKEIREMKGQLTVKGELGYDKTARTFPTELEFELAQFQDSCAALSMEEANRFVTADSALLEEINTAKKWKRFDWPVSIRYGYLVDKFNKMSAQHLLKQDDWDCFMLYFNMIDVLEHYFWMYHDEEPFKEHKIYGDLPFKDVVSNGYKVIDSMIGEVLQLIDDNTIVIVVSDHGFETFYSQAAGVVCNHTRAPDGILIASGPYIRQNMQRTRQYSVYDITPTILTILGIPLGADMDGQVMEDIFQEGFLDGHPIEYIDSHDAGYKWRSQTSESDVDTHMLEKFRALGYIQ